MMLDSLVECFTLKKNQRGVQNCAVYILYAKCGTWLKLLIHFQSAHMKKVCCKFLKYGRRLNQCLKFELLSFWKAL